MVSPAGCPQPPLAQLHLLQQGWEGAQGSCPTSSQGWTFQASVPWPVAAASCPQGLLWKVILPFPSLSPRPHSLFHSQWLFLTGPSTSLSTPARATGSDPGQILGGCATTPGFHHLLFFYFPTLLFFIIFLLLFYLFSNALHKEDKRIRAVGWDLCI